MMMKWGKQKASTSHHSSLISHVFPSFWLSRFKQSKDSSDQDMSAEEKKKGQLLPSRVSSPGIRVKEGRFYSADDDDSYWRLSFGDEQAEKLEGGDEMTAPVTFPRSSSLGREKSRKSRDMFFNLGQTRIVQSKARFSLQGSAAALRRKKVRGAWRRFLPENSLKFTDATQLFFPEFQIDKDCRGVHIGSTLDRGIWLGRHRDRFPHIM